MSARSSRRRALVAALLCLATATACGKKSSGPPLPEADPDKVTDLAARMAANTPAPAALRECTPADLADAMPLTYRSLLVLAKIALANTPEDAPWINPPELDAPPVRVLADRKAEDHAKRQAAAELLAAKGFIVYRVDMVNAPMALEVKELKRGTVGTRVIRYEPNATPSCVQVFLFQNDQSVSNTAIEKSDRAYIDPAVAKQLREDLTAQYIKLAPRPGAPAPK